MSKNKALLPTQDAPIKLQHPYTTDAGVLIKQVHIRMINVREMKHAQRVGGGDEITTNYILVATACDLVPEDLDKMMAVDFMAVQARFLELNTNNSNSKLAGFTGTAG